MISQKRPMNHHRHSSGITTLVGTPSSAASSSAAPAVRNNTNAVELVEMQGSDGVEWVEVDGTAVSGIRRNQAGGDYSGVGVGAGGMNDGRGVTGNEVTTEGRSGTVSGVGSAASSPGAGFITSTATIGEWR